MFFNILGILLYFPIPPLRRLPIKLAKKLGNVTADHRWFAVAYIAVMFFLAPAAIFALSTAGWAVLLGVLAPLSYSLPPSVWSTSPNGTAPPSCRPS